METQTSDKTWAGLPGNGGLSPENFKVARVAEWSFSLELGKFQISCVLPLSPDDRRDVLELLDLVKRQIERGIGT